MLNIPPGIQTLLKSKTMVGENRPTGVLWLGETVGGLKDIEFFNQRTPIARPTGYNVSGYSNQVSNYVLGTDGREFCAIINTNTFEVHIGHMDNNEDYFVKNYPVTSITPTGIFTQMPYYKSYDGRKIALHRLKNGKIIMLLMTKASIGVQGSIDCYISNNGLGTDFEFLTNIYTGQLYTAEHRYTSTYNMMLSLVRESASGALYFTANIDYLKTGDYIYDGCMVVYKSSNNGAGWERLHTLYMGASLPGNIASPCVLNDGMDLIYAILMGTTKTCFVYSRDGGITWTWTIKHIRYDNLSLEGYDPLWTTDLWETDAFYDASTDTFYRWMANNLAIAVMYAPSIDKILADDQFDDIWFVLDQEYSDTTSVESITSFGVGTYNGYLDKNYKGNWMLEDCQRVDQVLGVRFTEYYIVPKSITIDRSKGSASQATIVLDNKGGIYSPDNAESEWAGEIWPNKEILVTLGYGAEQQNVFAGYIDEVNMSTYPAELTITARDKSKLALDQTITVTNEVGITSHTTMFINETPEYIFSYLAVIAGYDPFFIFTEASGVVIEEITFSQESYADAFQRLAETAGFEWLCDENGNLFFRKAVEAEPVSGWTFSEGEDIFSLGYTISDAEVYRNIEVIAQDADGTTIYSDNVWPAADYYGLPINKTLIIQATDLASNLEQCAALANQAAVNLSSKPRRVEFVVVGHPYLQIGDCVTVIESSSTISEIYRIWSLTHNMNANGSPVYTTSIKCYWYASGGV